MGFKMIEKLYENHLTPLIGRKKQEIILKNYNLNRNDYQIKTNCF